MRRLLHLTAVVVAATLATACSVLPEPASSASSSHKTTPSPAPRPIQKCNQAAAQWAVGKTNTENTIREARKRSGAYMARVLRPGQITTREFNAERLNLEVDGTGRIIKAFCG